jgi:hypothetical protein
MDLPLQRNIENYEIKEVSPIIEDEKEDTFMKENDPNNFQKHKYRSEFGDNNHRNK